MITVVTGPPCSGKSTYIRENAAVDDIVIDLDVLALALTTEGMESHGYSDYVRKVARDARLAAVKSAIRLAQGERYLGVWIVHSDPSVEDRRGYRAVNAQMVEMNPGKAVCLQRLEFRPLLNRVMSKPVIEAYYAKR
jgi:hypothetical protein